MTMSWLGLMIGWPLAGLKMLLVDIISTVASTWASIDKGRWTAIWSPSKSALKPLHTSGWMRMALPSMSTGSNAWMPMRWKVGARFSMTGWFLMTSSRMSQTSSALRSSIFLADLIVSAWPSSLSRRMMNGWNNSRAIFLGRPHWCRRSSGPTTMTERAEHRPLAAVVVEQGVDGLLQHALLVADDNLGGVEVHQLLEAVVAVDDAPVQVVEVAGGEVAAVEQHQRAQVRRDDRDALQDHPLRLVRAVAQRLDDLEALDVVLELGL